MSLFSIFYFLFFAFILGAIVGSFLNVVVLRIGTGRGMGGRSACLSCGKKLGFFELVPIFSFLFQGGRCIGCKSAVSIQYILVEAVTALAFALVAWKVMGEYGVRSTEYGSLSLFSIFYFLFSISVTAVLVAIVAYDIKHLIIPDAFVFTLFGLALVRLGYLYWSGGPVIPQIVSALGVACFLFILFVMSRGQWLGLGDVKLITPLALLLPWSDNLVALILAFWSGAIVGLLLIGWSKLRTRGRKYVMRSEIPFAPFLVLGTAIAYFIEIPLFLF